jgi:RNA polymerase sigma factor (sigma-70 family)
VQHFTGFPVNITMQGRYNIIAEDQLIQQVLTGERDAFRILVENYKNLVAHIVYRMIYCKEDREDICQDVFIKIYQNISNFHGKSKLSTWIARIAYNTCINHLEKKEKKRTLVSDDLLIENYVSENSDDSIHKVIEEGDIKEKLTAVIELLPEIFRIVITLYHLEGMKYQEISQVLDKPEGTIKSYLYRARQILKIALEKKYYKEEFV